MPEDRGNCAILAFMAQVQDVRHNTGCNVLGAKCPYIMSGTSVNHFLQHVRRGSTFPVSLPCIHAWLFPYFFVVPHYHSTSV